MSANRGLAADRLRNPLPNLAPIILIPGHALQILRTAENPLRARIHAMSGHPDAGGAMGIPVTGFVAGKLMALHFNTIDLQLQLPPNQDLAGPTL